MAHPNALLYETHHNGFVSAWRDWSRIAGTVNYEHTKGAQSPGARIHSLFGGSNALVAVSVPILYLWDAASVYDVGLESEMLAGRIGARLNPGEKATSGEGSSWRRLYVVEAPQAREELAPDKKSLYTITHAAGNFTTTSWDAVPRKSRSHEVIDGFSLLDVPRSGFKIRAHVPIRCAFFNGRGDAEAWIKGSGPGVALISGETRIFKGPLDAANYFYVVPWVLPPLQRPVDRVQEPGSAIVSYVPRAWTRTSKVDAKPTITKVNDRPVTQDAAGVLRYDDTREPVQYGLAHDVEQRQPSAVAYAPEREPARVTFGRLHWGPEDE